MEPSPIGCNITVDLLDDLISSFSIQCREPYKKTALFYHMDCLKHYPVDKKGTQQQHDECPQRCSISYNMLNDYGLLQHFHEIQPREASIKELYQTHAKKHVNRILLNDHEHTHGYYDGDTFYNSHSCRAARLAAGAAIDLLSGILQHKYDNGFALCRPPGHHCEHNKPMGFCLFNNAAIAVDSIRKHGLCDKVLIVDWDVHHGNGTENMFYEDDHVLYFSVHRHDNGFFYPGTGRITHTGEEEGEGFNVNVPLNCPESKGAGDKEYVLIWKHVLLPICREFKPDVILISAGFDACIGDPLGRMRVTPACFGLLTRLLLNECERIGMILEGGYNLSTMPRAICCCNYALLKGAKKQKDEYDIDEFYTEFKESIVETEENEAFHQWFDDYKHHLEDENFEKYKAYVEKKKITENIKNEKDFSNYIACKNTIKEVLEQQQKYWLCAAQILKTHYATQ